MTTREYIPGYLGTIELGTDDISASGMAVSFTATANSLDKPHFGSAYMKRVSGMLDASITANGHVSGGADNELGILFGLFEGTAAFDFTIVIGSPGGPDGGSISGQCIVTDYSITGDATDEWEWSATLQTVGAYAYTPAVTP